MTRGRPKLKLIGHRFGRLLVIAEAPTVRYSRWRCRCDCGAEVVVSAQLLRMGAAGTRSCGCLRREQRAAALKIVHANRRTRGPMPERYDARALTEAMQWPPTP